MNVYRGLYFSTLTGTLGGLCAALIALLLAVPFAASGHLWLPDTLSLLAFGLLVGVLLYMYFDKALLGSIRGSSVGYGIGIGLAAAVVAAGLAFALGRAVAQTSPVLFRIAVWTLCFSLVSLGLGLRWVSSNRARVLHTYAGGLAGALLAGLVFVLFASHLTAGVSMAGLMLAGAGTGFGAGIAPTLVRDGLLRFISSGDARAHNKLAKSNTLWDLKVGESYVIGSAPGASGGARFQQGADVYLPDSSVAPLHAVVFHKDGRYFLARHPDASGPEGIARYVLRLRGKTVVQSQELHPADDVLIGRTALRFESRKQGE